MPFLHFDRADPSSRAGLCGSLPQGMTSGVEASQDCLDALYSSEDVGLVEAGWCHGSMSLKRVNATRQWRSMLCCRPGTATISNSTIPSHTTTTTTTTAANHQH
ncbi:unnamed protein product [Gadus morhua 'NCC']